MSDFELVMVTWWVSIAVMVLCALAMYPLGRAWDAWRARRKAERRLRSARYLAGERRRG